MDTNQQYLDTYINTLIDKKNFGEITPEIRAAIVDDLRKELDAFVLPRMLARLSPEKLEQFKKLLNEGKTQEEMQQFVQENVADYKTYLAEILHAYEEAYLQAPEERSKSL